MASEIPAEIPAEIPVLIAGAGPVGLALAAELGRLGVRCLLVEEREGRVTVPKMSQVSSRNMEFCRRWGIADKVRTAVWSDAHALDFVYMECLTGAELARLKIASYAERGDLDFTPEGACHCPQIYFDPILADHVKSLGNVEVRYNTRLESFSQGNGAVHGRLVDRLTGAAEDISATYLVGCDGPGGVVRDALGIDLGGQGVVANSINIFFRSPELASLHHKGWARFYRAIDEAGCWSELIAIDGQALWRLTIFDDPSPDIDAAAYLRKLAGRDFPFEVIDVSHWERRDYVAARYRDGRVFIAGDAAHQCSPTGGLGMHTGLEEAVNLAWKLAAMIKGWGGRDLLESYEAERRPVARRNVDLATGAYTMITEIPGLHDAGLVDLKARVSGYSLGDSVKSQYGYDGSAICIPDGSALPEGDSWQFTQSARPGTRAPHGWVEPGLSTLDLFGDGFVLLRFGDAAPDGAGFEQAAKSRAVPLRVVTIESPAIAELYEASLVVVRPDGHVAWRADAATDEPGKLIDRLRGQG